jgi:hypothetical protein
VGHKPDGTRIRRKVTGRTKAEVRDKLRDLHQKVSSGRRPRKRYTVSDALEDWLAHGVDVLSARTVTLYRGTIGKGGRAGRGAAPLVRHALADGTVCEVFTVNVVSYLA